MKRGFEIISSYLNANIKLPTRNTYKSAGYDIEAADSVIINPQEIAVIPTGLKAYMQDDEYLGIFIRSSLAFKQNLNLVNSQGIIDADYYNNPTNEGHIMIGLINFGDKPVHITKGMRIAQGIFFNYLITDDDATSAKEIRQGGFGSTGK